MTSATFTSSWAEAPQKIARMTLTIKLDRNWSSFQLAINTPPLSVTGSVIAPSARMLHLQIWNYERKLQLTTLTLNYHDILCKVEWERKRLSCGSVYSGSLPHSALAQVPSTTSSAWFCLLCRQAYASTQVFQLSGLYRLRRRILTSYLFSKVASINAVPQQLCNLLPLHNHVPEGDKGYTSPNSLLIVQRIEATRDATYRFLPNLKRHTSNEECTILRLRADMEDVGCKMHPLKN